MAEEHIGSLISANCGASLGVYQGRIMEIDQESQTMTLENPFRNGKPYGVQKVILNSADIASLEVLKLKADFEQPTMVSAPRNHRGPKNNSGGNKKNAVNPIDIHLRNSQNNPLVHSKSSILLGSSLASGDSFSGAQSQYHNMYDHVGDIHSSSYGKLLLREGNGHRNNFQQQENYGQTNKYRSLTPDPIPSTGYNQDNRRNAPGGNRKNEKKTGFYVDNYYDSGPSPTKDFENYGQRKMETHNTRNGRHRTTSTSGGVLSRAKKGFDESGRRGGAKDLLLSVPIPADELIDDFDFDGNNALFDKAAFNDDMNMENGERGQNSKAHRNFRHDENIIQDNSRVNLWVNKKENSESEDDAANNSGTALLLSLMRANTLDGDNDRKTEKKEKEVLSSTTARPSSSNSMKTLFVTADEREISVPTVSRKLKDATVNSVILNGEGEEFLSSNISRGIFHSLLHTSPSLSQKIFAKPQNGRPSNPRQVVILTGGGRISVATGFRLAAFLGNTHFGGPSFVTLYHCDTPKVPATPFDKKLCSGISVVQNGKVTSLPRSRETGLVISLLWSGEIVSPLLQDWIRSAAIRGVLVTVESPPLIGRFSSESPASSSGTTSSGGIGNTGGNSNAAGGDAIASLESDPQTIALYWGFPTTEDVVQYGEGARIALFDLGLPFSSLEECASGLAEKDISLEWTKTPGEMARNLNSIFRGKNSVLLRVGGS